LSNDILSILLSDFDAHLHNGLHIWSRCLCYVE